MLSANGAEPQPIRFLARPAVVGPCLPKTLGLAPGHLVECACPLGGREATVTVEVEAELAAWGLRLVAMARDGIDPCF
jgi:hypothetical protein